MIIEEAELLTSAEGLTFVKGQINMSNNYILLELSAKEYTTFCKQNNISVIFYDYSYYNKEKYIVSEELLRAHTDNSKEYSFCAKWADSYNAELNAMDFNRANKLSMVATFGAMNIMLSEEDKWLDEYEDGETALIYFIEENEDTMAEFLSLEDDDVSLYDEFRKILLSDSAFRYSTNKNSRRLYTETFFRKKENKKYLKLVMRNKRGYERVYAMHEIIDKIYNEYRNACYNAKIHVGEELPWDE